MEDCCCDCCWGGASAGGGGGATAGGGGWRLLESSVVVAMEIDICFPREKEMEGTVLFGVERGGVGGRI